ncbi:MAG: transglycosylase SLT domain-containing protein [Burkholderiales bacterium]
MRINPDMRSKTSKTRPALQQMRWIAACLAFACAAAAADPIAGVRALEAVARYGDLQALVQLAAKYERGEGVAKDLAKSRHLYCQASARGDAIAQVRLGLMYFNGGEVQPDEGVAALLFSRAAEQGNEQAKRLLEYVSWQSDSVMPECANEPAPRRIGKSEVALLVHYLAPRYSIDPKLVMALISTESAFHVNALSPKDAQGLMQLIPVTAERFGVKNAYNPVENLKGGIAYLQWLLAYFQGDVALVLAAYNAGEEAVDKYRGIPPYRETRDYVKRITRAYKKKNHPYNADLVEPSLVLSLMSTRAR